MAHVRRSITGAAQADARHIMQSMETGAPIWLLTCPFACPLWHASYFIALPPPPPERPLRSTRQLLCAPGGRHILRQSAAVVVGFPVEPPPPPCQTQQAQHGGL